MKRNFTHLRSRQEEANLVALGVDAVLLCECKWRNERTPVSIAGTLLRRGVLFPYAQKAWCIFSKSGFEKDTVKFADEHGVRLVDYAHMLPKTGEPRRMAVPGSTVERRSGRCGRLGREM